MVVVVVVMVIGGGVVDVWMGLGVGGVEVCEVGD